MWNSQLSARRAAAAIFSLNVCFAICAMFLASTPANAVTHVEFPDAGQTTATAQPTASTGLPGAVLTDIFGSLRSPTDADLYLINIFNIATFSASTVNPLGGLLDTQLFLLTTSGAPVSFNDDDPGGLSALSTLSASAFGPSTPGQYLLGISLSGYDPVNAVNQLLFATGLSTEVRGPASGLQPARLGGFSNETFSTDIGAYDIHLIGAATVPEPATLAMLALGGVFAAFASRRRRTLARNRSA